MSLISKRLRQSDNKQKVIHRSRPERLPRGRVAKECPCGSWFELPACHAHRHNSCSAVCATERRKLLMDSQVRPCDACGHDFRPRPNQVANGKGRFCSKPCALVAARKTEAFKTCRDRAVDTFRKNYRPKLGPENPQWTGGPAASSRRRTESGEAARWLREYRNANPQKARELAQNRRNRLAGRLEYGTIPRLMEAQQGKCAYCRACIRNRYHLDHIMPLAKGGRHEAGNVQLLCPPCNLRKSDKDPIAFAQLNGRLL